MTALILHLTTVLITSCPTNGIKNNPSKNAAVIKLFNNVVINHRLNPTNALRAANNKKFNTAAPIKIGNAPRINNVIATSNTNLAANFKNLLNK